MLCSTALAAQQASLEAEFDAIAQKEQAEADLEKFKADAQQLSVRELNDVHPHLCDPQCSQSLCVFEIKAKVVCLAFGTGAAGISCGADEKSAEFESRPPGLAE